MYHYTYYDTLNISSDRRVGINTYTSSNVVFSVFGPSYFSSNIGIGIQPKRALEVSGDINYTGDLYQNDILIPLTVWSSNTANNTLYYKYGKVGVGTTIAKKALDVQGDINFSGNLYQNNSLYVSSQWNSNSPNNTLYYKDGKIGVGTTIAIQALHVQGNAYTSGSIGIGSTLPVQALDVAGTIRGSALTGSLITDSTSTTSSTIAASAAAVKSAFDNGSNAIVNANTRVLKAGDTMTGNLLVNASIGIGSTLPVQALDVAGTIRGSALTGSLITDSTSTTSSTIAASATAVKSAFDNGSNAIVNANTRVLKAGDTMTGNLVVNASIGIGSTLPIQALDVAGTIRGSALTGSLITDSTSTTSSTIAASATAVKSAFDNGSNAIVNANTRVLKAGDTMTGNLIVNANIGIGSTLPVQALDVAGTIRGSALTGSLITDSTSTTSSTIAASATAVKLAFDNGSNAIVNANTRVLKAGDTMTGNLLVNANIGINTTTPLHPLHVQGQTYISDSVGIGTDNTEGNPLAIFSSSGDYTTQQIRSTQDAYVYTSYKNSLSAFEVGINKSDTDNGSSYIYNYQSTDLAFATNSSYVGRFTADGRFGIGTTGQPISQQKLDVVGGAYISGSVGIGNTNPNTTLSVGYGPMDITSTIMLNTGDDVTNTDKIYFTFVKSGSRIGHSSGWNVNHYAGYSASEANDVNGNFHFFTGANPSHIERFTILNRGSVGIGSTLPIQALDVDGTIRGSALTGDLITDSTSITSSTIAASATAVKSAYDTAVNADANANTRVLKAGDTMTGNLVVNASIGIGSTQPIQALDVDGTIRGSALTGDLITDSTSITSSTIAASATAVKSAYDTAVNADANANTRVLKAGDTMTGNLVVNASIGIGSTLPVQALDVAGTIRGSALTGSLITDSTSTTSSTIAASATAVKSAYDTAVNADANANTRVLKAGDTMTGNLLVNASIGIGSTLPIQALDVAGTIRGSALTGTLITDSTSTTSSTIAASATAVKSAYDTATNANNNANTRVLKAGDTMTGNLLVNASIGIGSTLPIQVLDVVGTALISTSVGIGTKIARLPLHVQGNAIMTGSVGLGTTNPIVPIHLEGSITYASGSVGIGTTIPFGKVHILGKTIINDNTGTPPANGITGNSGTRIIFFPGSAASVPISLGVDTNTLWTAVPTGNYHKWYEGTTERMRINAGGCIGIGTTNPLQLLHVQGNTLITGGNLITSNFIGVGTHSPLQPLHVQGTAIVTGSVGLGTTNPIVPIQLQGTTYASGNVGIGSTQPRSRLDVAGFIYGTDLSITNTITTSNLTVLGTQTIVNTYTTYTSNLTIDNQNGGGPALLVLQKGVGGQYPVADFYDRDVSTTVPALRVADGANVGIGTATPLQPLHVQGQAYFASNVGIGSTQPVGALDVNGTIRGTALTGGLITDSTSTISSIIAASATAVKSAYDTATNADANANTRVLKAGDTMTGDLIVNANVGIGSTQPVAQLDVSGTMRGTNLTIANTITTSNLTVLGTQTIINTYTSYTSNIVIDNQQGSGPALLVLQKGQGGQYPVADFYDRDISTTVPALRIADGANVGIGTATPLQPLHVQGQSYFSNSIGIGTTIAKKTLDVQGDINFAGSLYQNNSLYISSQWTSNSANNTLYYKDGKIGVGTTIALQSFHMQGVSYFSSNVGIGTTNPPSTLSVGYGATDTTSTIMLNSGDTSTNTDKIYLTYVTTGSRIGHNAGWNVNHYAGNSTLAASSANGNFHFFTGATPSHIERFTILNNGSVGIGSTQPSQALDISGTALISTSVGIGTTIATAALDVNRVRIINTNAYGQIQIARQFDSSYNLFIEGTGSTGTTGLRIKNTSGTNGGTAYELGADNLRFYTNGTTNEKMRLDLAGNLGIGTTTPLQPLHVQGQSYFTSNVYLTGGGIGIGTTSYTASALQVYGRIAVAQGGIGINTHGIGFFRGDGSSSTSIACPSSTELRLNCTDTSANTNITLYTTQTGGTNAERVRVQGTNVGIGTATPLQTLHVQGLSYLSSNVGIGSTLPVKALDVVGNVNLGNAPSGTSTGITGGPFFKQVPWDTTGTTHTLVYPTYCQGDNSAGTLSIQISNKSTVTPKMGNLLVSFIKLYNTNVSTFVISSHLSASITTTTNVVTVSGNNIVISTDSDCSITWTSTGGF